VRGRRCRPPGLGGLAKGDASEPCDLPAHGPPRYAAYLCASRSSPAAICGAPRPLCPRGFRAGHQLPTSACGAAEGAAPGIQFATSSGGLVWVWTQRARLNAQAALTAISDRSRVDATRRDPGLPNAQLALNSATSAVSMVRIVSIACVRLLPCRSIAARIFSTSCPAASTSSASRCKSAVSVRNAAMIDSMSAEAIFSGKLVITDRCCWRLNSKTPLWPAPRPADCRWRAGTCHQHGKTGKAGADGRFPHTTNLRGFPPGLFSAALFYEGAPLCLGDRGNPLGHTKRVTAAVTSFLVGRWSALVGVGRRSYPTFLAGASLCAPSDPRPAPSPRKYVLLACPTLRSIVRTERCDLICPDLPKVL
jgi:hypothetical protein